MKGAASERMNSSVPFRRTVMLFCSMRTVTVFVRPSAKARSPSTIGEAICSRSCE